VDKKSDEREERRKKKRLVLTLCAANPRSRSATISSFFKSLARFSFFSRRRSVLVASVTSRDEVIIFGDDADILYSRFLFKKVRATHESSTLLLALRSSRAPRRRQCAHLSTRRRRRDERKNNDAPPRVTTRAGISLMRVCLLIKLCFFCAYELCRVLFVVFECELFVVQKRRRILRVVLLYLRTTKASAAAAFSSHDAFFRVTRR